MMLAGLDKDRNMDWIIVTIKAKIYKFRMKYKSIENELRVREFDTHEVKVAK